MKIIFTEEMKSTENGGASKTSELAKATQRWMVPEK